MIEEFTTVINTLYYFKMRMQIWANETSKNKIIRHKLM